MAGERKEERAASSCCAIWIVELRPRVLSPLKMELYTSSMADSSGDCASSCEAAEGLAAAGVAEGEAA